MRKLSATVARSLQAEMQGELRDIERAVAAGTRDAGRHLRTELRRQVTSAGLGRRLARTWRDEHYPNRQLDAASLVYTKAPQIIRAFDEGAVIRSRRGRFLAIPTENAPRKGTGGRRISPSTFPEHRFGPLLGELSFASHDALQRFLDILVARMNAANHEVADAKALAKRLERMDIQERSEWAAGFSAFVKAYPSAWPRRGRTRDDQRGFWPSWRSRRKRPVSGACSRRA